ncbi:MAG: class I SAM-dependent methyltransferase [Eubacteriales bacterium]|nr:class I SAM-dependent methyltransferase [Eubacteriales bacterium]
MADTLLGSRIAGGNTAYSRSESDYYPTPPEATKALLDYLKLQDKSQIWEPACGEGHIAEVLLEYGHSLIATDLFYQGYGEGEIDFLNSPLRSCDWIITNPPFKLAEQFIRRCHEHNKPFALLLKSQYWHSKSRYSLFKDVQPTDILPLTWRPDFLFKTRGKGSPLMDCIWCVWRNNGDQNTIYYPLTKPIILRT